MLPVCILEVGTLAMVPRYLLFSNNYLGLVEGQCEECSSCILLRSVQLHQYAILRATWSVVQTTILNIYIKEIKYLSSTSKAKFVEGMQCVCPGDIVPHG